jgi:hypothetical protein
MISSCAVEARRSTADWASSGSAIIVSHSSGVLFEVTMVAALPVAFDAELVEVGCLDRVHGLEGQVVDDEKLDAGQAAHLGFEVLSSRAALSRLNSLAAGVMCTVARRRTAMWPSAQARWVLPTPTVMATDCNIFAGCCRVRCG